MAYYCMSIRLSILVNFWELISGINMHTLVVGLVETESYTMYVPYGVLGILYVAFWDNKEWHFPL